MKNRNSDEILQYIASSGMLDIGNVERAIDMQKNKEYLSKHTQKSGKGKMPSGVLIFPMAKTVEP